MTKAPDWESALKAAMIVAKCSTPPFRYQVVSNTNPMYPVGMTLTLWSAWLLADALQAKLGDRFMVFDMNGKMMERVKYPTQEGGADEDE
jgi:hypothetical protein